MIFDVLILCGGKNSRIQKYKKNIIKPLIEYKKKSILGHHLKNLKSVKIKNVYINIPEKKKIFFKKFMTKNIKFIYEKKPTGTAGVFFKNWDLFHKYVIVIYGDNYLEMNFEPMIKMFKNKKFKFLISVYKKKDLSLSGRVVVKNSNEIISIEEKKIKNKNIYGLCNAGVYIFDKNVFKDLKIDNNKEILDFSKNIIPGIIKEKKVGFIENIKKCLAFDNKELYTQNIN